MTSVLLSWTFNSSTPCPTYAQLCSRLDQQAGRLGHAHIHPLRPLLHPIPLLRVHGAELNSLYGPIPSSWVGMPLLVWLNLRMNCGVCGELPPFRQLQLGNMEIYARGSSLGYQCGSTNCSRWPGLGFLGQGVVILAGLCEVRGRMDVKGVCVCERESVKRCGPVDL